MGDKNNPTVSVIIPAYNASANIDETLISVRMQTYRALEVIVVDDGSMDSTRAIVEKHTAEDKRIHILSQANEGVASARNKGLAYASGPYVAPVDADDLWRPEKIEMQMASITSQRGVSLVYTWFAAIDTQSRIRSVTRTEVEGAVLPQLCMRNLIGHASSPLMKTTDVIRAGGYDTSLRARHSQGSEDWALYLKLAETGEFAVVKSVLTGYRTTEGNMSSDYAQMIRSTRLVLSEFAQTHPEYRKELRAGQLHTTRYYLGRAMMAADYRVAVNTFLETYRADRQFGLELLVKPPLKNIASALVHRLELRKRLQPGKQHVLRPHFLSGEDPEPPNTLRLANSSEHTTDPVPARAE